MERRTASRSRRAARMVALAAAIPVMAATFQATPALSAPQAAPAQPAAVSAPAAPLAAPARADKKDRAVYFIHGIQLSGKTDCKMWDKIKKLFKDKGWTGKHITWGYYKKNTNCTYKYNGTQNSEPGDVAKSLAWHIYNNYTSKGKTVDVVAHSLGGIVIRNAIVRVKKGHSGFPKKLYVEDVVTLGTPHSGSKWANACTYTQCVRIRPGSSHIKWLNDAGSSNHQATGGTDWTVLGSHDDGIVTTDSATSFKAKHKIRYPEAEGVGHSDYYNTGTGSSWTYWRSSDYGKSFKKYTNTGNGPMLSAYLAAYYHSSR